MQFSRAIPMMEFRSADAGELVPCPCCARCSHRAPFIFRGFLVLRCYERLSRSHVLASIMVNKFPTRQLPLIVYNELGTSYIKLPSGLLVTLLSPNLPHLLSVSPLRGYLSKRRGKW